MAPFFNLSDEKAVDGRRFALAYQAELQKVSRVSGDSVGIVEDALREHHLALDNTHDVQELAKILDADAVVIVAVTDYSPTTRHGSDCRWPGIPPAPGSCHLACTKLRDRSAPPKDVKLPSPAGDSDSQGLFRPPRPIPRGSPGPAADPRPRDPPRKPLRQT